MGAGMELRHLRYFVAVAEAGSLTVAAEILPRTILRFRRVYPLVELQMGDMSTPSQVDSLLDGRIDVGILRLPVVHTELDSLPLVRERFVAVTPASVSYSAREGLASLR